MIILECVHTNLQPARGAGHQHNPALLPHLFFPLPPAGLSSLPPAAAAAASVPPLFDCCFSASFFFCLSRAFAVVDSTAFSTLVTSLVASVEVEVCVGVWGVCVYVCGVCRVYDKRNMCWPSLLTFTTPCSRRGSPHALISKDSHNQNPSLTPSLLHPRHTHIHTPTHTTNQPTCCDWCWVGVQAGLAGTVELQLGCAQGGVQPNHG